MPLKVYYIDDEPDLLELFSDQFSSADVVITTFSDPKEALIKIALSPPDLIFLDYRLPNTTGDIIAQKIDSGIPKVLISGDLLLEPKADFVAKFSKPFRYEEIMNVISKYKK